MVNQPVEAIKNYYQQNEDNLDFFKHTLLEKQAIKLIIESSNIEEVKPELEKRRLKVDETLDSFVAMIVVNKKKSFRNYP